MWQAPNPKMRLPSAKKSRREHPRRAIHIKRVTAEIRTAGTPNPDGRPATEASARILLNDLSIKGVGIFCDKAFRPGQEIAIHLTEPSSIYLRGKIIHCQEHDSRTHVISSIHFGYRIGIQFIFADATEEAAVRTFCEGIFKSLNEE
jgi:hypothetical protein